MSNENNYVNYVYYYANPKIHFFPRAKKYLFEEEKQKKDGKEIIVKKCELNNIIDNYNSSTNFSIAGKYFKEIEEKIYLDLSTFNSETKKYKVSKKCCVGFLGQTNDGADKFFDTNAKCKTLEVICEFENGASPMDLYLDDGKNNNKNDSKKHLIFQMNNEENTVKEFTINIEYKNNFILPAKEVIKIKFRFSGDTEWKSENTFKLTLYRNQQNTLDGFKQQNNLDTDFFVLPNYCISYPQSECVRQLEIINNQVFARNKKLQDFSFIRENGYFYNKDGNYDSTLYNNLKKNIKNSITSFKTDAKDKTKGCRSGNKIGYFKNIYNYSFEYYGQKTLFLDFLSENYKISIDELKGRILDRTFLFGRCENYNPTSKYEGIVNLYRNVVIPFINDFKTELNSFLNRNVPYLSCPAYNENYQRGPLTVTKDMNKYLYEGTNGTIFKLTTFIKNYTGTDKLPENSVIRFTQKKDDNAFNTTGENYYRIDSFTIPGYSVPALPKGKKIYISLSYKDKQKCKDNIYLWNYGNYTNAYDTNVTNTRDILAIKNYRNFGIPYYIFTTDMPMFNKKANIEKLTKQELFSWHEIKDNWYSYEKKPNTEQFGIDCSGLISNCILNLKNKPNSITRISTTRTFESEQDKKLSDIQKKHKDLDIQAKDIGNTDNCRQIDKKENQSNNSFLQQGDIIYTEKHIGACSEGYLLSNFQNNYVEFSKLSISTNDSRYFNVIHNYGMEYIYINALKNNKYSKVFSLKTIDGPYRHWGTSINDMKLGRLYLWN